MIIILCLVKWCVYILGHFYRWNIPPCQSDTVQHNFSRFTFTSWVADLFCIMKFSIAPLLILWSILSSAWFGSCLSLLWWSHHVITPWKVWGDNVGKVFKRKSILTLPTSKKYFNSVNLSRCICFIFNQCETGMVTSTPHNICWDRSVGFPWEKWCNS